MGVQGVLWYYIQYFGTGTIRLQLYLYTMVKFLMVALFFFFETNELANLVEIYTVATHILANKLFLLT